jgi:pimeloyl-ACP methyl ester carboxylesterase
MMDTLTLWILRLFGFRKKTLALSRFTVSYIEKKREKSANTIVIVHGIGSRAVHFASLMILLSRRGHSIIAVDLPSHGDSTDFKLEAAQTPSESLSLAFSESLLAVAPARFVLYGNSLGGALSFRFASEYPERVESLILASPGIGFETESDWFEIRDLLNIDEPEAGREFLSRVFHRVPFFLGLLLRPFFDVIQRPQIRALITQTQFEDLQLPAGLAPYPGPQLLIWGKSERLFKHKNVEVIRTLMAPHLEILEPERAGHCAHFDRPHWTAKTVSDYSSMASHS